VTADPRTVRKQEARRDVEVAAGFVHATRRGMMPDGAQRYSAFMAPQLVVTATGSMPPDVASVASG
jgi:hypothetical protein